jgi:hypothetical protein
VKRALNILTAPALALVLGLAPATLAAQSVSCERGGCNVSDRIYRDGRYFVQEITGTLPASSRVSAESDAGWIRISGAKQADKISFKVNKRVRASSEQDARRIFDAIRFKAYTSGPSAILRGEPSAAGHNAMLEMDIQTPRNVDYAQAQSRGGSVEISGIGGKANAESYGGSIKLYDIGGLAVGNTMGGSIEADKIGGDVKVETAGGSVSIGSVGGNIMAETAGGSISVEQGKGNVTVETAGGSIGVKQCNGALKATTAGGSIDVGDIGLDAYMETAGGGIRLNSAKGQVKAETSGGGIHLANLMKGVYAETMAGGIEAEFVAKRGDFTDSKLITNVGDIIVYLPSDLGVTVRATIEMANGHRVVSDFPEVKVTSDGGDYGPRTVYGNGQINGGGPLLKLSTSNGNIVLRRTNKR